MIRVLVVDDSRLVRTVLRDLLEADPEIRVLAEAGADAFASKDQFRQKEFTTLLEDLVRKRRKGVER